MIPLAAPLGGKSMSAKIAGTKRNGSKRSSKTISKMTPKKGVKSKSQAQKSVKRRAQPLVKEIQTRLNKTHQAIRVNVSAKIMERADQVLLGLSHAGETIPNLLKEKFQQIDKNPDDLIGRLGRTVLEHAEEIKLALIEKTLRKDSKKESGKISGKDSE